MFVKKIKHKHQLFQCKTLVVHNYDMKTVIEPKTSISNRAVVSLHTDTPLDKNALSGALKIVNLNTHP